jgi:hypothetical protein
MSKRKPCRRSKNKGHGQPGTISNLFALSQQHLDLIRPYLERIRTEDIGRVEAEAFEGVEEAATQ